MATLLFDIETISEEDNLDVDSTLSPTTAKIATITLYDVERKRGSVYNTVSEVDKNHLPAGWTSKYKPERELLRDFWEGMQSYDTYVGFGTRRFDTPFLVHRSAANSIQPATRLTTRKQLAQQSFPFHIDLLDELSFYGSITKHMTLKELLVLYKIETGDAVKNHKELQELFLKKDILAVESHCHHKILAAYALYEVWKQYFAPPSFMNAIEY